MNIEQQTNELEQVAKTLAVTCQEDFDKAGIVISNIKRLKKVAENSYKPIIEKAHEAHKEAISQLKKILAPMEWCEVKLKEKMNDYVKLVRQQEQEALRLAEIKAQEQARVEAIAKASEAPEEFKEQVFETVIEAKKDEMPFILQKDLNQNLEKNVKVKTIVKWKLKDIKQVSYMYITTNDVLINAIVRKALKGAEQIVGGIEVYEEEEVR